jgi:hypothetical protein
LFGDEEWIKVLDSAVWNDEREEQKVRWGSCNYTNNIDIYMLGTVGDGESLDLFRPSTCNPF